MLNRSFEAQFGESWGLDLLWLARGGGWRRDWAYGQVQGVDGSVAGFVVASGRGGGRVAVRENSMCFGKVLRGGGGGLQRAGLESDALGE